MFASSQSFLRATSAQRDETPLRVSASTETDHVHIAYGHVVGLTRQQVNALLRGLEPHERERAARFTVELPRRLYVLARAIIRVDLARVLGCRPQAVRLASTPQGKPYVVAPRPAPEISVTHGGTMAACALTWVGLTGIDVEPKDGGGLDLEFAREHFAANELRRLAGLTRGHRDEALVAIWTAKEAVVKAHGDGLSIALKRFSVPPGDGVAVGRGEIGTWRVRRLAPDPVHRIAVALGGDPSRPVKIHQRAWSAEALIAAIGST